MIPIAGARDSPITGSRDSPIAGAGEANFIRTRDAPIAGDSPTLGSGDSLFHPEEPPIVVLLLPLLGSTIYILMAQLNYKTAPFMV